MDAMLLKKLCQITEEEQAILDGRTTIDRGIYMDGNGNTINAQRLLASGKLITLRPHTRFIHFPKHTHDYVEVVYMCTGETTHIVNGNTIRLRSGELLFMNQSATHEILTAGEQDLAVNFIVLPEFFSSVLPLLDAEQTPLLQFLVDCLCGQNRGAGFLHFQISRIVPIQNLLENLLYALLEKTGSKRKVCQTTMALLFLQLMDYTETLNTPNQEQVMILQVLSYIETHYCAGSLTELAKLLHYDVHSLSREIKQRTGKNYTQLVQEKRLAQAAFLLRTTDRNVNDIANAVGYENVGYFHRIFNQSYGISPRRYRLQIR